MLHEVLIGNNSGLWKSIHALSNFNNDVAIVNKRGNIVFFNDGVVYVLDMDAHVLIMVEGCAKVYFFEIGSHELRIVYQGYAVEDAFDIDEIRSFSSDIVVLVDDIATNSP